MHVGNPVFGELRCLYPPEAGKEGVYFEFENNRDSLDWPGEDWTE